MLRTYRINFKKNWSVSPSKWVGFLTNLQLDMKELFNEMNVEKVSYDNLFSNIETTLETGNQTKVDEIL